ncbi:hypothetical protein OF001_U80143 [Pseudomonas sp. OF001]|nr:hypothetical protein OF001_U80143 [Pseudomonas sp. OF001]
MPDWALRGVSVRAVKLIQTVRSPMQQVLAKIAQNPSPCASIRQSVKDQRNIYTTNHHHEQARPLRPAHPRRTAARCTHLQPGAGRAHRPVALALFAASQTTGGRRLHPAPGRPARPQEARPDPHRLRAGRHGPSHPGALRPLRVGDPPVPAGAGVQPGHRHGGGLSAQGGGAGHGSLPAVPARHPDPHRGGIQRAFELRAQPGAGRHRAAAGAPALTSGATGRRFCDAVAFLNLPAPAEGL